MRRKWIIFLLICLCLLSTSCAKRQGISVYDLKNSAQNEDKIISKNNKELLKNSFDRHYANDMYWEDFSDEKDELTKGYVRQLELFAGEVGHPSFATGDIEFYNQTLSDIKNNKISISEVLKSPEAHLRKSFIEFYFFSTMEDKSNEEFFTFDQRLKDLSEVLRRHDVEFGLAYRIYDENILKEYPIDELRLMEFPFLFLMEKKMMIESASYTPQNDGWFIDNEDFWITNYLSTCDLMFEQYGVEFVGLGWSGDKKDIYALKSNPDIQFEVSGYRSHRFVPAYAQYLLSDIIYEMIDEEGASDYMGVLVAPNSLGDKSKDKKSYDLSKAVNPIEFLNNAYDGNYNVSLIYLAADEDSIDYGLLKRLSSRLINLLEPEDPDADIILDRISPFIDIYFVESEQEQKLITNLLYDNRLNTMYFDESTGLGDLYSDMYLRRVENEAFHYLDIYAKKLDYFFWIMSDPINWSDDEFIEMGKEYSEF